MNFQLNKYKRLLSINFLPVVFAKSLFAQSSAANPPGEDSTMWYVLLFGLGGALLLTLLMWRKKKSAAQNDSDKKQKDKKEFDDGSHTFDADKELEWLRKNKETVNRQRRKPKSAARQTMPHNVELSSPASEEMNSESRGLEFLNSVESPVFEIERVERAAIVDPLPLSDDDALLNAIEQSQDEDEEDEEIREISLRILAAFKTRNSVEALSQMAVYDLSSSIRSKAVTILSEFDHASVFEAILLACADPTREVRAAAARAFSRLSFDRADAWARIIETNEQGRMVHAARAAIEGGFVERSFERLTHRDKNYAYEAFTLVALLIKAGEVQQLSEAVAKNRDLKVKSAIVHVLSVVKDENSTTILNKLLKDGQLPEKLKKEVEAAVLQSDLATA